MSVEELQAQVGGLQAQLQAQQNTLNQLSTVMGNVVSLVESYRSSRASQTSPQPAHQATSSRPAMAPQFKLKMPERFDGKRRDEYALSWLYGFNKYAIGMQLSDEQINSLLSTLFIDHALTWFRMLEMALERDNAARISRGEASQLWTWEDFKRKFEAYYVSPLLKEKARRALKDVKMHKSVAGYNAQFNNTLVQCGLDFPEEIALDYYLDNLHPALMAWVRQVAPTSLEQAQTEADRQERTLKLTVELSGRMPAPRPHRRVDALPPGDPMQLGSAYVPGSRPAAGRGRGDGRGSGRGQARRQWWPWAWPWLHTCEQRQRLLHLWRPDTLEARLPKQEDPEDTAAPQH